MTVSKELYQERKNYHLCTRCGIEAHENKTLCLYHLQKASKNQKAIFTRRKQKGLCPKCGDRLTNNRKTCNKCLEKNISIVRDEVRIPWTERARLGLCVACGKPNSTSNKWCSKCYCKYSATQRSARQQRIADGLCGVCGKGLLSKNKNRCAICIHRKKKWYASSNFRQKHIQKYKLIRDRVIKHYGGQCICCGETEKTFLAIDHINGNGNAHRKQLNRWGSSFDMWLINQDFPDEFQILCHNCNMSKYLSGGICAHKLNAYLLMTGV